jgi:hypothetical protein
MLWQQIVSMSKAWQLLSKLSKSTLLLIATDRSKWVVLYLWMVLDTPLPTDERNFAFLSADSHKQAFPILSVLTFKE